MDGVGNEPGGRTPAPEPLRLVQSFINTNDREAGRDILSTPAGMKKWFIEQSVTETEVEVGQEVWRLAVDIREDLRLLALANNTGRVDPESLERLGMRLKRFRFNMTVEPDGRIKIIPGGGESDRILGEILVRVAMAMETGAWRRLKACQMDVCRWAFYDHSKNGSSRWCAASICGNRAHVRSFRGRRIASAGT